MIFSRLSISSLFTPTVLIGLLTLSAPATSQAQEWTVTQSHLSYEVKHLMKTVHGISNQTKGLGKCDKTSCSFLFAVPVASFDSENSNRDAHMQQVMKASEFPMAQVRVKEISLKEGITSQKIEIELAGKKHSYTVTLQLKKEKNGGWSADTKIPLKLSDFDLERPSLLTVKIQDEVPIETQISLEPVWKVGS